MANILMIDDSEDDLLLTKLALSKNRKDIHTESALSSERALALLQDTAFAPDLVLLDVKMPRLDGIEVLRRIRRDERLRDVPVIMITNSELEADKSMSYEAGANGFLRKAPNFRQFVQDVGMILDRWIGKALSPS